MSQNIHEGPSNLTKESYKDVFEDSFGKKKAVAKTELFFAIL